MHSRPIELKVGSKISFTGNSSEIVLPMLDISVRVQQFEIFGGAIHHVTSHIYCLFDVMIGRP